MLSGCWFYHLFWGQLAWQYLLEESWWARSCWPLLSCVDKLCTVGPKNPQIVGLSLSTSSRTPGFSGQGWISPRMSWWGPQDPRQQSSSEAAKTPGVVAATGGNTATLRTAGGGRSTKGTVTKIKLISGSTQILPPLAARHTRNSFLQLFCCHL